jgi:hypothetical protein
LEEQNLLISSKSSADIDALAKSYEEREQEAKERAAEY